MPRLLVLSLALMVGCGEKDDDDDGSSDGGTEDGGSSDGGTEDGGSSDGGTQDGGSSDGGTEDGGSSDGGTEDGGSSDGGTEDGGSSDGGGETAFFTDLSARVDSDMGSIVWVSWTQEAAATVHVEYSFDDDEWLSSPSFDAGAGEHEQILLGIPFDTEVDWRVVSEDSVDATVDGVAITTDTIDPDLPRGEVLVADPDAWLPDHEYLLTSINERTGGWTGGWYWTMIIDRQARPVWAHKAPSQHWTLFAQVSVTGDHILWDEATAWSDWDDGRGSVVHRTYLDQDIDEFDTPGLHHAFVQLPDETLVWGSQYHSPKTETLVEMSLDDLVQDELWTCSGDWPGSGYCESNGLFYQESTDSFLYSFYTNNSVVEVDRATGESLWWAGEVRRGYSFDEDSLVFSWQHGISYTDDGTLLLSSSNRNEVGRTYTPAIEYTVDHDEELLTEVWSYDPGVHASTNGDTWRLDNGNTLHVIGSSGHLTEVDPDGEIVWHVDYDGTHLLGRGELISDLYALVSPDARH